MLILPLHRALNRATFPFLTIFLVIVNVMVFTLAQQGDGRRLADLRSWYASAGLAEQEWPHYLRYLEHEREAEAVTDAREWPEEIRSDRLLRQRMMDARLEAVLRVDAREVSRESFDEDLSALARLQQDFDTRLGSVVTYSYLLRQSEVDPVRMITHAFLHGGGMHLLGNMLFLVALGLLVEGPLGEWRFGLLYLIGILGSASFSLVWHWGEVGGGLGASGGIAALMGAFCVIWGRRPVRFFWWLFVAFGYIRKPAIWLLPIWIGWEASNLIFNADAGVGFEAHLGGLLTGALVGWALLATGKLRNEFLDDEDSKEDLEQELSEIRSLLGQMQIADAGTRLTVLELDYPERLDIALLQHRAAVLSGVRRDAQRHALRVLQIDAANIDEVAAQLAVLEEAFPPDRPLPEGDWRENLRRRWMALACHASVQSLLERISDDGGRAQHWFELALSLREHGDEAGFWRALEEVKQRFPAAPEAVKARFWLQQLSTRSEGTHNSL